MMGHHILLIFCLVLVGVNSESPPVYESCSDLECVNGYCNDDDYDFPYCVCEEGYTGMACETFMADYNCGAADQMCYNGGECMYSSYSGYYCNCSYGYYGVFCEYSYMDSTTDYPHIPTCNYTCLDFHCHNGGHCVTEDYWYFYCVCPEGYIGTFCEYHVDTYSGSCADNPCQNGGWCFDMGDFGGYQCLCPMDGMGYNCEHDPYDKDPCSDATCDHGTCLPGLWDEVYSCVCEAGYYGDKCDIPIDYDCGCLHGTCAWNHYSYYSYYYNYYNGYWNFPSPPNYYYNYYYDWYTTTPAPWQFDEPTPMMCMCDPGYTGYNCETQMMSCAEGPCQNGGACTDYDYYDGFYCSCPDYVEGEYCESGMWGDWYESDYCSRPCGGGYKTMTRYCLAGYGKCQGRSVEHVSCNTQPCGDFDHSNSINLHIDGEDLPWLTEHEHLVPEIIAYIVNLHCTGNPEECCDSFGYSTKTGSQDSIISLVTGDQCFMNYVNFTTSSIVIQISAYTTYSQLSQICEIPEDIWFDDDYYQTNYDEYYDDMGEMYEYKNEGRGKRDMHEDHKPDDHDSKEFEEWGDWFYEWDPEDYEYGHTEPDWSDWGYYYYYGWGKPDTGEMIYLSAELLLAALTASESTIEQFTGMNIIGMGPSAQHQTGDDNDDDDDDDHHGNLAKIIGLSVGLGVLGLILLVIITVFICKKLKHPKNTRAATPESPTSNGQGVNHRPTTPHDLFLVNGSNGLPPTYQQVVMYPGSPPPTYAPNAQVLYGDMPVKKGALPPINEPEVMEKTADIPADMEKGGMNNNPAPPAATIYEVAVPQNPLSGKLPPIQKE